MTIRLIFSTLRVISTISRSRLLSALAAYWDMRMLRTEIRRMPAQVAIRVTRVKKSRASSL